MRELMSCGTRAAYARHRSYGEVPCDECRGAWNTHQRTAAYAIRNRRVQSMWVSIIRAAYRDEVAAEAVVQKSRGRSGESSSAPYMRAVYAVAARHPDVSAAARAQARQEIPLDREATP